MKHFLRFWLPVIAHAGAIFFLSSRSTFPKALPGWVFTLDKVAHGTVFGLMGFLFLRAWLSGVYQNIDLKVCAYAVGFTLLYGISDEVHQMFVPGRNPSLGDVIADATGALIVCMVVMLWVKTRK